jgi:BirA family biotin operon repressor/biotin-[acetyl-CoA-carboxylase] ligase
MTGSRIILLDEVSSTNDFIQELRKNTPNLPDGTVVWTVNQTNGKGQMGKVWLSEPGKNLMFSIFISKNLPDITDKFRLSMEISMTVLQYLRTIHMGQFLIKWPNDILLNRKKIAGMLLENSINNTVIQYVIAGIGINLNQTDFQQLPYATSLCTEDGVYREPENVLHGLVKEFNTLLPHYQRMKLETLRNIYLDNLYGYKEKVQIKKGKQNLFTTISNVDKQGAISLADDESGRKYGIKELEFYLQPS